MTAMYKIIVGEKTYFTSGTPHYVKKKISSGAWIPATKIAAEGIALMGEVHALQNVVVKEIDDGEVIFDVSEKTLEGAAKIVDIQEALCDLSEMLEELQNG